MTEALWPYDPRATLEREIADRFARRMAETRAKIAALERELEDRKNARATLRLSIDGEGGGVWFLNLGGGELKVEDFAAEEPLVSVVASIDVFQQIVDAATAAPALVAPGKVADLTASRISRLRSLRGTIEFGVTDLADGRELRVTVHLGPGDPAAPPALIVSVKAADAERIRSGALSVQAAFMQGMIGMKGDVMLAMSFGMAMS